MLLAFLHEALEQHFCLLTRLVRLRDFVGSYWNEDPVEDENFGEPLHALVERDFLREGWDLAKALASDQGSVHLDFEPVGSLAEILKK